MEALEQLAWSKQAQTPFRAVFSSADPFGAPFSSAMSSRAILFPVAFILDRGQFAALFEAAAAVGEREVLLSVVEGSSSGRVRGPHWRVGASDYDEYCALGEPGVLENALYSPSGLWGLLVSHEQHALVGGKQEFISTLEASFPKFRQGISAFLAYWRENRERRGTDTRWIVALLSHLYGQERSAGILSGW